MQTYKWALVALSLGISSCLLVGQNSKLSTTEVLKSITLIDKITHTRYVLDSTHMHIIAIDSSGKQLWKTNPWRKEISSDTLAKQPTIDIFSFDLNEIDSWLKKDDSVIGISYQYHHGPFGVINKKTGRFLLIGEN